MVIGRGSYERLSERRGRAARGGGFTLIELMIVVIVLSVLTAMIVPQFAGTYQAAVLRATARQLVAVVRLASSEAVTRNQVVRLVIDPTRRRYWLECREREAGAAGSARQAPITDVPGAAGELHEKVLVEVRTEEPPEVAAPRSRGAPPKRAPARGTTIAFNADGTTDRSEIELRDQQGFGLALRVHPSTARVDTVELDPEPRTRRSARSPAGLGGGTGP